MQHRWHAHASIRKGDVLEPDSSFPQIDRPRRLRIADRGRQVQHGKKPRPACGSSRNRIDQQAELPNRRLEDGNEGEEYGERAYGHGPIQNPQAPDPQNQTHSQKVGEGHNRGRGNPCLDPLPRDRHRFLGSNVIFLNLVRLCPESANDADTGQVLVHDLSQCRHSLLQSKPHGAQLQPRDGGLPRDERHEA